MGISSNDNSPNKEPEKQELVNGKPRLPQKIINLMKARGMKLPEGYEDEEKDTNRGGEGKEIDEKEK